MQSLTEHLWFEVPGRHGFINITPKIQELVSQSGVREGLCLVNAMHITASVFINDTRKDCIATTKCGWKNWRRTNRLAFTGTTAPGRITPTPTSKRQIMGREVVVAITKGKLDLGPWEQIFYGEFDGCRRKRVLMKVIGE